VDIVVKGRRTEVSERYRSHVREKLARLAKLDGKAFRIDVEVCHENNPRMSGMSERIELTVYSRGPVIRAEAAAGDSYAALDMATAKLEERLRRAADRRHARQHGHGHGAAAPPKGAGVPPLDLPPLSANGTSRTAEPEHVVAEVAAADDAPDPDDLGDVLMAEGPLVVRSKTHEAPPMTLDEALHHMELVGHDFFLFCDSSCDLPSVVYRRRGYTYGVLRLKTNSEAVLEPPTSSLNGRSDVPGGAASAPAQAPPQAPTQAVVAPSTAMP
jgi:ribosomal subunit interface protein